MLELILLLVLSGTLVLSSAGVAIWLIATGQLPRIDALLLLLCSFWLGMVFLYITRYVWRTLESRLGSDSTTPVKAETEQAASREMPRQKQERATAEKSEEETEVIGVR